MKRLARGLPLVIAASGAGSAAALELIFFEDFESDAVGAAPASADVVDTTTVGFPGSPGTLAQVSDVQSAPTSGTQSLLLQDDLFAAANSPQVFWNLTGDDTPLDSSRTLKLSYWHFVADDTVVGPPQDAFSNGEFQHVMLTASRADQSRPEGNGGYLAQAWNWQEGPAVTPGSYTYKGNVDAGVFPQPTATVDTGQWYRIDNYIPMIDLFNPAPAANPGDPPLPRGSSLFTGLQDVNDVDGDGDTDEFRGYIDLTGRDLDEDPDNDREPDVNVFYSRVVDGVTGDVAGQTPYMVRRGSDSSVAGEPGLTDPDFRIRALQLFGGLNNFKTSFYDDLTVGYVDTGDITTVIEGIAGGSSSPEFDYDGSGTVDDFDATYYIQTVLLTAYGDTNYDFQVDLTDLQTIADNFDTATSGWANGDLNGDGLVNQADVDLIGQYWHHTLVVPEPGTQPVPTGPSDFEDALTAVGLMLGEVLAGDYNDNGLVEQGDLNLVLNNWGVDTGSQGVPPGWLADFPEGLVDQAELNEVLNRWGSTAAPSFAQASVPEPGALAALAALGAVASFRRRTSSGAEVRREP